MELNRILSDSPPLKRQQLDHPSFRRFMMKRKPNPSELEVAELMISLSTSTSPSPCSLIAKPNRRVFDKISNCHNPPHLDFTPHQPLPHLHASISSTPKKGRRSTTTKRMVLSPSGQPCANCGVETSTLWRTCELHNGSSYLCNACGLRYKKGKFCPICYRVYYDVDTNQLQWKQCHNCMNWTHKSCLQQRGITATNTPYICLNCSSLNVGKTIV